MTEQSEQSELCGAPHPWIPHRTCRRVKGHATQERADDYHIMGIVAHRSTHADYAGSWASTRERLGGWR